MSENTSNVKPLPVKRRRSFGGKNGVWWSRRRTPKTNNSDTPTSHSSSHGDDGDDGDSPKQSSPNDAGIEWDEDLCRPIYRTKTTAPPGSILSDGNHGGDESIESSSLEDDGDDDASPTPSSPTSSRLPQKNKSSDSISKRLWMKAPVKRNKSFGTRKRAYSFLLHEPSSSSSSNSSSPLASQQDSVESSSNASTSASTTLSFSEAAATAASDIKPPNNNNNNNNKKKRRPRRVLQKDEATLQKAKQFFEQLDAERLTVDSAQSPPLASKVTRTSYKVNLQSPRLKREYKAYSMASKESGVTPWSMEIYASCRREYFRKRELFDGFLDG
ncbi:unnamed protein product [Cylindrotheca closterium]|uniref:Uncharacterized protein n=1 Tax=Cylindrotheca closterium TaxID=2856 RepID=A0AAD2CYR2_9STRA|nr:unnamed protein product [Cylindrotheca closterium]